MIARRLLFAQFWVVLFITVLHLASIEHDLYWRFLWLDTVTHALGGVWAGLFFLYVRTLTGRALTVAWSIVGALILGVMWELLEVIAGIGIESNYHLDTSLDLFMDALGGLIGAHLAFSLNKHEERERE